MKKINHLLLYVLLFFIPVAFAATGPEPVAMLDSVATNILNELEANRADLKDKPEVIHAIIRRHLVPRVDVYGMSRSVIGRAAWRQASRAQRRQFTKEFTQLVIRTYAAPLADYDDETVKFYPIRGDYSDKRYISVRSDLIRKDGSKIPLNYSLVRKGQSWKVYDMSIEGVSLLQSFRTQFASELSGKSFQELINKLARLNAA